MLNLVMIRSSGWGDIVKLREHIQVLFVNWRVRRGDIL